MAMLISSIVLEINVFNYTVAQEKNAVAAGAKSNYAYYWYLDTPYSSNSLGYVSPALLSQDVSCIYC